jgi:hypothetical protein
MLYANDFSAVWAISMIVRAVYSSYEKRGITLLQKIWDPVAGYQIWWVAPLPV